MIAARTVACGSCSACCCGELIALVEGDIPALYPDAFEDPDSRIREILPVALKFFLPHGKDGNCVYLVEGKCSVYDYRPQLCRTFDCTDLVARVLARVLARTTRAERRADKAFTRSPIFKAGMKRLKGTTR